jgi:modulator of drug activity B
MKNVLIINGHQRYEGISEGNLTKLYIDTASEFFKKNGFALKHSIVESDYNIAEEVEKFVWADYILFQYPVYWMSVPWMTKKYIDDIFSVGGTGILYTNDGRSRNDASKKYGSGGLMQGTKYMLSLTYNCPASEFSNKDGFFDGLSLDETQGAVHKTFEFCGAEGLETYSVHDIFKGDLDVSSELKKFTKLLEKNFKIN